MNINTINKLCDRYVIMLDKFNNNLIGNIDEIENLKIFISVPTHTFHFKLIKNRDNIYQIQCLNTFKILTIKDDENVFFEEYFELTDLQSSFFYCIYDEINVSLFSFSKPNYILCFNQRLCIKNIDIDFLENDQTIFEYESIDYNNILFLCNRSNLFSGIKVVETKTIKDFFYNILNIYKNVPEYLFLCFGKPLFPLDYYISQKHWVYIDRYFDINNMKTYKRRVNLSDINNIDIIPSDNNDWLEIDSISSSIPKISSTQMIWQKIINGNFDNNVYFCSTSTYILRGESIKKHSFKYYNDIYLLLDRSNDIQIHNLMIYALYTIFFM
jgi:hypothetical protein